MIFSTSAILSKSISIIDGTVISAKFDSYETNQVFQDVFFSNCIFPRSIQVLGCIFTNCTFYNCQFYCSIISSDFYYSKITGCKFKYVDMGTIDLDVSTIEESEFTYSYLRALDGGIIRDCKFEFCKLEDVKSSIIRCQRYHVSLNEPDTDNL